jgi:hypothetical protein
MKKTGALVEDMIVREGNLGDIAMLQKVNKCSSIYIIFYFYFILKHRH